MEISIKPGTPPEKVFTERSGSKYDEAIKTAIANKAKPATSKPVIAPDLNAIVKPDCKLFLAASAVRTLALTEINIPTYPATPDKNAPIKYPNPTK